MVQFAEKLSRYRSLEEIEEIAEGVRLRLGFDSILSFDRYNTLLENLPILVPGYSYRIVPDDAIDSAARVVGELLQIQVRRSLDFHGQRGDSHSLMCLMHEVAHVVMGHFGVRNKVPGFDIRRLEANEKRDEWEANRLAGAILMPEDQWNNALKDQELARRFDVTAIAVKYRRPQISDLRERRSKSGRRTKRASNTRPLFAIGKNSDLSIQACTQCGNFSVECREAFCPGKLERNRLSKG